MEEGNVLVGSRHASEIRWLFQAGLLAAIGIPIYVLAFLSGNLLARAVFGFPVLIAIVGVLIWLIGRLGRVTMTVPRLAVLAAITTLVVGSTIGVLVQLELASKNA